MSRLIVRVVSEAVLRSALITHCPPDLAANRSPIAITLLVAAIFITALNVYLVWVGYIESDDLYYAFAAQDWLKGFPYLGVTHWGLRHLIILPIAFLFGIFGSSEPTLVIPSVLYAGLFLGLLTIIAYWTAGLLAAGMTVMIVGSLPVVATGASFVSTDLPEAFFVLASVWAFNSGLRTSAASLQLLAGILAGCAAITRETACALLIMYGALMFLVPGTLAAYTRLMLGMLIVIGLDWIYLYASSGDPFYRLHMALAGAHGDGPQFEDTFAKPPGLDRFGSLDVARWIKPIVTLFANQNFGLFYWMAIPATIALTTGQSTARRDVARLTGGLAVIWFIVVGYFLAHWLWIIPRYYIVCLVLAIPLATSLAQIAASRPVLVVTLLVVLVGSNTALNLGATTDNMAGERALVKLAQSNTEIIHTDPATYRGALWLLNVNGVTERVSVELPPAGALYLFNSKPRRSLPADWPVHEPGADWTMVSEVKITKWTRRIADLPGLRILLPAGLLTKLDPPPHVIGLFRLPAG